MANGGFRYAPPRPIQYRDMNPLKGLSEGIATGMQLGGMMQKNAPSEVKMFDPDDAPSDVMQMMEGDIKDLEMYKEWDKKTKGDDPMDRWKAFGDLKQGGAIKSEIIANAMEKEVKPGRLNEVFSKVRENHPTSMAEVNKLVKDLGGPKSPGGRKILEYQNQMKNAEVMKLKQVLTDIRDFHDNPKKWTGRSGIPNPQTMKTMSKEFDYVQRLSRIDPKAAEEHLSERGMRRGGRFVGSKERLQLQKNLMQQAEKLDFIKDSYAAELRRAANQVFEGAGPISKKELKEVNRILEQGRMKTERSGKKAPRKLQEKIYGEEVRKAGGDKDVARDRTAARLRNMGYRGG